MILTALKAGFKRAIRDWQITLLLLIASTALALPMAIPFVSAVVQTTAFRLAGRRLLSDSIDATWFIDFANEQFTGASLIAFSTQVIVIFIVIASGFLISNVVLAGGVLEVLVSKERRFSMRMFFSGSGYYLWRFVRLWVISLAVYGAVFFVYLIALAVIDGYEEAAVAMGPIAVSKWLATLLLAATFALINLVFMYARISTVVDGASSMIRQTALAIAFVAQNAVKTSAVYAVVLVVGLVLFGVIASVRGFLGQNSLEMAMLAWVVGQLAIACRLWARVAAYASGIELYRALAPAIEIEPKVIELTPEFAAAIDSESSP
jgi:hypothetical protein